MKAARRFAFGHEPAAVRPATLPAQSGQDRTVPLPLLDASGQPPWEDRSTLPLGVATPPVVPVLLLRAPITPEPREAAPLVPPYTAPVTAPRSRRGGYLMIAIVLLALYSAALVVLVAPRRAVDAAPAARAITPTIAPAPSVTPSPEASMSAPAPRATVSILAPSAIASAPAPRVTPPRAAPVRLTRPPAPARTAKPASEVLNPWGYD
jgi:hypothetical protein